MSPELILACAKRDVSAIFRILNKSGIPQRRIAELVGMSQSEVSEILKGRQVMSYDVLVRIAEGLGIPRGLMGLAYDEGVEEVDEEMKRRALFGVASVALFNSPVLGELLQLPKPATPTPLPSRLGASDVTALRNLTEGFRGIARTFGGCANMVTPVAQRSLALAKIPGVDIKPALAELQTMAGWCCVDSGHYDNARSHFALAMELGDPVQRASAFHHAGVQMIDSGAYNDGLKAFQLGIIDLSSADDPRGLSWLHLESAIPYAAMGHQQEALTAVKKAREQPQNNPFDAADMDWVTSRAYWRMGKVDLAEQYAQSSVMAWDREGASTKRDSVNADITLALIHAKAGEPDTVLLVKHALAGVAPLKSVRARRQLGELVGVLEARTDSTSQQLAYHTKKVSGMVV
jgi:transcriptional regulator with XRE-family HTH domain